MSEWNTDTVTVRIIENGWNQSMKALKASARIGATVLLANCSNVQAPVGPILMKESKSTVLESVENHVMNAVVGVTPEDFRALATQIKSGSLPRSPELVDAARQALARLEARKDEDRAAWRKRLADEASDAVD